VKAQRTVLVLVPPVLLATMGLAFRLLSAAIGVRRGYFVGFVLYWLVWCVGCPALVVDATDLKKMFASVRDPFGKPRWFGIVSMALPLAAGYAYALPRAMAGASAEAVLASAALAVVNAPLEEILWRGTYARWFPDSWWLGYVYPSVGFAVWHLAPLSIVGNRAPGGTLSFVVASTVLGLLWGWVARRTGTIRWTSVVHILFDFSGLGGRLYFG
jgi:hypothetical protein